ncbi:MAG: peptide ABC transporter ATP-binding protein [Proteobacteria bacterium SG_bin9]|nr:MAG: peptide ABC transporter ATP-binding protein [Proteobacteria bacterium SG_bin9]
MSKPLLQVKNLTTKFGSGPGAVTAVNNVSFDVNAGETVAIVGESGSGKSITALSILRLVPDPPGKIVGGEILFDGIDLTKLSEEKMRDIRGNRIAMIFQEPMTSLNPSLTIGLQIAEPINLHMKMPWQKAYAKAKELLDRVRMPDAQSRLETHPHQFSGGMRQRIMIAMALACQPKLIIADEPTTALDVTVQAQILELLKELTRETGSALILITHDLGVVARYADRVCVMYGGKIIETASARELYGNPLHPYTRGLMASIPRLDQQAGVRLVPIKGQPPNLAQLPPGCSFNPRCSDVVERCRRDVPALMKAGDKHMHACWVSPHEAGHV